MTRPTWKKEEDVEKNRVVGRRTGTRGKRKFGGKGRRGFRAVRCKIENCRRGSSETGRFCSKETVENLCAER